MAKVDKRALRRQEARALQAANPRPAPEVVRASELAKGAPHAAWMSLTWQRSKLAFVALARKRTDGDYALLVALADLGCLGVKSAKLYAKLAAGELQATLDKNSYEAVERAPAEQVAQVLAESLRWAEHCGFEPTLEGRVARAFFAGVEPQADFEVPLGEEGEPLFVPGPNDKTAAVLAQLEARFGEGGFHYVAPRG
jgi:hypothetical protein